VQRRGIFSLYSSASEGFEFSGVLPPYHGGVADPVVLMYSRTTCGLCDKARVVIQSEQERTPFQFEEVFIDGDDGLELDFGLRVPVVMVNGEEEFEYTIEPVRFRRLLSE
jgi:glutaredoxin-like protein DUF836